jgi:hypothetical protein
MLKSRIHRWLLGLALLLLMPGTFLACLFFVGLIGSGFQVGWSARTLPAALILIIPPVLVGWGFRLMIGLREGFHIMLRRKLLAFYLAVLCYCSFWLFAPISHEGAAIMMFEIREQVIGSAMLLLPVLITLFTNPEVRRSWNPSAGRSTYQHRRSDRFVAWLASRMR